MGTWLMVNLLPVVTVLCLEHRCGQRGVVYSCMIRWCICIGGKGSKVLTKHVEQEVEESLSELRITSVHMLSSHSGYYVQ